ncbi:MAG TPA: GntR family transcriptional regulator [Beijerinckiaceae bacterium]|nr:GntR family transcriptional regulator [Beijerinckiaceae bacterium]
MSRTSGVTNEPPLKLREKAYRNFTARLLSRDIRPGQFISQRELVEITGMPLGAIRELVPRLEADGLITTVPQRGMQIAHVDLNLIRNAFQFRMFMEREAAAYFVETAPDAALESLRQQHLEVIERARRGISEDLIRQAQETDWNFHDTIIDHLDNEIVSNAYRVNSIKIRLIRQEQTRLYDALVVPVMEEHLRIIDVFFQRSPQSASAAIAEHIANARNRAMKL